MLPESVNDFETLAGGRIQRERCWTESVAVGSLKFIEETKARLGIKAKGRKIKEQQEESYMLREESAPYNAFFATEIEALRSENVFFWEDPLIDLDG